METSHYQSWVRRPDLDRPGIKLPGTGTVLEQLVGYQDGEAELTICITRAYALGLLSVGAVKRRTFNRSRWERRREKGLDLTR